MCSLCASLIAMKVFCVIILKASNKELCQGLCFVSQPSNQVHLVFVVRVRIMQLQLLFLLFTVFSNQQLFTHTHTAHACQRRRHALQSFPRNCIFSRCNRSSVFVVLYLIVNTRSQRRFIIHGMVETSFCHDTSRLSTGTTVTVYTRCSYIQKMAVYLTNHV